MNLWGLRYWMRLKEVEKYKRLMPAIVVTFWPVPFFTFFMKASMTSLKEFNDKFSKALLATRNPQLATSFILLYLQ